MLGTDFLATSSQHIAEQEFSTPFFERTQNSVRFCFYLDSTNKLRAKVYVNNTSEEAILIKDLPAEWQNHLATPIKRKKLKELLRHSSFSYRNLNIYVAPGGFGLLGGWNEDVHRDRTFQWALKVFDGNKKWASYVANACKKVDEGATNPVKHCRHKSAQSWHFNVNRGHGSSRGGDIHDSRIEHAMERFHTALAKKEEGKDKQALETLGTGLHALQDCIAHLDRLVRKANLMGTHFYHHVRSALSSAGTSDTDDPRFIEDRFWSPKSNNQDDRRQGFSLRYTYTRDLTKKYLEAYKNNDLAFVNKISDEVIKRIDSLKQGLPLVEEVVQEADSDELPDIYRKFLKLIPKEAKHIRRKIGMAMAIEIPALPLSIDVSDGVLLELPITPLRPALPSASQELPKEEAKNTTTHTSTSSASNIAAIASNIDGYASLFAVLGKLAVDGWHKLIRPKQTIEYIPSQDLMAEIQNCQKQLDILSEEVRSFSANMLAKYNLKIKNLPQNVIQYAEQEIKQLRWSCEDYESDLRILQHQKHVTEKELSALKSEIEYMSQNACKEVEHKIKDFWMQQVPMPHNATRSFLARHQAAVCLASGYRPPALPRAIPMLALAGGAGEQETLRNNFS